MKLVSFELADEGDYRDLAVAMEFLRVVPIARRWRGCQVSTAALAY
jgi:hypothetical protein